MQTVTRSYGKRPCSVWSPHAEGTLHVSTVQQPGRKRPSSERRGRLHAALLVCTRTKVRKSALTPIRVNYAEFRDKGKICPPGRSSLVGGLKATTAPSPLCFRLRPPGGGGRAARTPARLLALLSPAPCSDLPGDAEDTPHKDSSAGGLLVPLNSESWKDRGTRGGTETIIDSSGESTCLSV